MSVVTLKFLKEILIGVGIDQDASEYSHAEFGYLVHDICGTPVCVHIRVMDESILLHTYIGTIYEGTIKFSLADPELIEKLKSNISALIDTNK